MKGDERKGEEGKAGGCEHLAGQPRQLPPRDGILSSAGCPIILSGLLPFHPSSPPQLSEVELGQGWRWEGVVAGFSKWPAPEACLVQGQPLSP